MPADIMSASIMPVESFGRGTDALYARSFAPEKDTTAMPCMPAELLRTFHPLFHALHACKPECILPSLRADRDQAATSER